MGLYLLIMYRNRMILWQRSRDEKDTFINNVPGEEDIPHHYTDENEIIELYNGLGELKICPYCYSYTDECGDIHYIHALVTICRKRFADNVSGLDSAERPGKDYTA